MPSIAPSGLAFYTGDQFPAWQGNLFVGSMMEGRMARTGHIERIVFNRRGEEIRREGILTELRQRIRDVRQGPDGYLYVLTDEDDGVLLRIEPARAIVDLPGSSIFVERLDAMYVDKLDGRIDTASFDRMAATWRAEQAECLRSIDQHQAANQSYMAEGVQLLELARNARRLFEKRRWRLGRRGGSNAEQFSPGGAARNCRKTTPAWDRRDGERKLAISEFPN